MFCFLVFISLLVCNNVIGFTLNAALLTQLRVDNQSGYVYIGNMNITDIDPNAFKGFSNLAYFTLDNTQLSKLDLSVFKDMVNLQYLYLQNNPLSQLTNSEKIKFPYLQKLNLYGSRLSSLDTNVLNALPNLRYLTIDNNYQLSAIKPNQLSSLKKLQYLTLTTKNQISLTKSHFTGLNSLLDLSFQSSNIKTIEAHTLLALPNVFRVNLMDNALTSLDYLQIPNKATELYLGGNKLNFFRLSRTMGFLTNLFIDNNLFRSFKAMDFTFLANLTSLSLSNNPHAYPNEIAGHLKPLVNLKEVRLGNLSIRSIDSNFFKYNTKLESIDLSRNKISTVSYGAFSNLKNLVGIDLSGNDISHLDNRTFLGCNSLVNIFLSNNTNLSTSNLQSLCPTTAVNCHVIY